MGRDAPWSDAGRLRQRAEDEAERGLRKGARARRGVGQAVVLAHGRLLHRRIGVFAGHQPASGSAEAEELSDGAARAGSAGQDTDQHAAWRFGGFGDRGPDPRIRQPVSAGGGADGQVVLQVTSLGLIIAARGESHGLLSFQTVFKPSPGLCTTYTRRSFGRARYSRRTESDTSPSTLTLIGVLPSMVSSCIRT